MNPEPVAIALVQTSCCREGARNLSKAVEKIREAAAGGARIICTQELFTSTYFCQTEDYAPLSYSSLSVWNAIPRLSPGLSHPT